MKRRYYLFLFLLNAAAGVLAVWNVRSGLSSSWNYLWAVLDFSIAVFVTPMLFARGKSW